MKEKIFELNGKNYKVVEIKEGHIYEFKKQKSNGIFYKTSRFNATSLEDAIRYSKECKID